MRSPIKAGDFVVCVSNKIILLSRFLDLHFGLARLARLSCGGRWRIAFITNGDPPIVIMYLKFELNQR